MSKRISGIRVPHGVTHRDTRDVRSAETSAKTARGFTNDDFTPASDDVLPMRAALRQTWEDMAEG